MKNNPSQKKLKIAILSPYLHIMGGGERYLLSIASYLSGNHEVTFFGDSEILIRLKAFLNISLHNFHNDSLELFQKQNYFERFLYLRKFDIVFYMTDGSVFFPPSKKNFLIIQSPVHIPHKNIINILKLKSWNILCYSKYMQDIIHSRLGIESIQLNPPIDTDKFTTHKSEKRNIILSVGRFFLGLHNKKQENLVHIFIKNYNNYFKGWELHLAGGLTEESGEELVNKLRSASKGFPIRIYTNKTFFQLAKLYKQSKIYWHGAGFEEDLIAHPEKAEHFGITTIEAMSAGTVPVVFKGGGQIDIVEDGKNGYFWESEKELISKTKKLMDNDQLLTNMSNQAVKRSHNFSQSKFYANIKKIIQ